MTTEAGLVAPDQRRLLRSPLVNVIWQVRFTPISGISDGSIALLIQSALGDETSLKPISPQLTVQMVSSGSPVQESLPQKLGDPGWRISTLDDQMHVSLFSDSLGIETTQYEGWSSQLLPMITKILDVLTSAAKPAVMLRLGFRYVNAIFGAALDRDAFSTPSELADVVSPALLGLIAHPNFAPFVEQAQARHLLKLSTSMCHIQHGLATAENGEIGLLLDIDSYIERSIPFSQKVVLDYSEAVHSTGLSVFQLALQEKAWESMGPVENAES